MGEGGVANEEEEAGEEHHDGQAHPLAHRLRIGLGVGQGVGPNGRRLGGERGSDLGPLTSRQRDGGRQL